jgi:Outer membrane protein beta-barrel domain
MKRDMRTCVALCLLAASVTATAQVPDQTVPAPQRSPWPTLPPQTTPQQSAQPAPATPPQQSAPAQEAAPPPQSPPPPQYQYTPETSAAPPPKHWTEQSYSDNYGFQYHPFRFHIDAGGTITQRANNTLLDNGWNAGLGFTWFPSSQLPFGLRVDGTYMEFSGRTALLDAATATYGTRVDEATQKMWGGDVDLEINLPLSPYVHMYLLVGGGWYRQQTTYRQQNYSKGLLCDWWGCESGYYSSESIVARNTTDWHFAKNAGVGFDFAMGSTSSFFVEARYMRLNPADAKSDFLPIRAGLRF